MSSTLFDYEWQFLIQMISRVNYAETYTDTCNVLLQQMKTLIPFRNGIVFQANRQNGDVILKNPVTTEPVNDAQDHDFFTRGNYPHWNEFIMAPYSIVFRQSDLIPASKWEKSRVYREVWAPKGHYWGLFVSLVHKDVPLAVLGLMRERSDEDFSARDLYILNSLKDPFERKFYALLQTNTQQSKNVLQDGIVQAAAGFGLTKRETEIVILTCTGTSSEDMCRRLFITQATLSKHLTNIYSKTKVHNRTQLFGLFSKNI